MAEDRRTQSDKLLRPFIDIGQGIFAWVFLTLMIVFGLGKVLRKKEIPVIRGKLEAIPGVQRAKVSNEGAVGSIGYYVLIDVQGVADQSVDDAIETLEQVHAVVDSQRRKVVEASLVHYTQQVGDGVIRLRGNGFRLDKPDERAPRMRELFDAVEDGATWASSRALGHVETRR